MSVQEIPGESAERVRAMRQARAWHRLALPLEQQQLHGAFLEADLSGDDPGYVALEDATLREWFEHRDDPLPPEQQQAVEFAQAIAWLGEGPGKSWLHAHVLALNTDEPQHDVAELISTWREFRDDPLIPDAVTSHVSAVLQERETRLSQAKQWHREQDPDAHAAWKIRRGAADTLGDEWADDRALLHQWARHADPTSSPTTVRSPDRAQAKHATAPPARSPWTAPEVEEPAIREGLARGL